MFDHFKKRSNTYKKLLNNDLGKEFLKFLATECLAYGPTFVAGDTHQTAFNEGKRQVYNHIVGLAQQDPELLHKMFQQATEKEHLSTLIAQEENIYG